MDKDALEGLISLLDNWAAFFTLLVVIGVGGELVIHVMSSRANKKLIALQKGEALLQESEIARMRKDSASFELDIAKANKSAAEANERAVNAGKAAAEANLKYEEERKARLLIEQRMADRDITAQQRDDMLQALKGLKPEDIIVDSLLSEGREALQYAGKIADVFRAAGWNVPPPSGMVASSNPLIGVRLVSSTNPDDKQLYDPVADVLIAGKICTKPVAVGLNPNKPKRFVEILVGSK